LNLKKSVFNDFIKEIYDKLEKSLWNDENCGVRYTTEDGKFNVCNWPYSPTYYWWKCKTINVEKSFDAY
jgi:hypothetical protein